MTSLVRTKSCGFTLSQCVTVEDIKTKPVDELCLWAVDNVLSGYYPIVLDDVQKRLYLNGVRLDAARLKSTNARDTEIPKGELLLIYAEDTPLLLGVGMINEQGELVSVKHFEC